MCKLYGIQARDACKLTHPPAPAKLISMGPANPQRSLTCWYCGLSPVEGLRHRLTATFSARRREGGRGRTFRPEKTQSGSEVSWALTKHSGNSGSDRHRPPCFLAMPSLLTTHSKVLSFEAGSRPKLPTWVRPVLWTGCSALTRYCSNPQLTGKRPPERSRRRDRQRVTRDFRHRFKQVAPYGAFSLPKEAAGGNQDDGF